jgi:hypothetical protein
MAPGFTCGGDLLSDVRKPGPTCACHRVEILYAVMFEGLKDAGWNVMRFMVMLHRCIFMCRLT